MSLAKFRASHHFCQLSHFHHRQLAALMSNTNYPINLSAARLAIRAAAAVLVLLASLHTLSPEFDPSWRVVSEYANGRYGWVLSLMFASWAVSSWALTAAVRPQLDRTIGGKTALGLLIAAGVGQAMASVFDINHPLHELAGMIGVLSLPIAAMWINVRLVRTTIFSGSRRVLLWTANLTWASLVLLVATLIAMTRWHSRIHLVGWANRFMVVIDCVWMIAVAGQARPCPTCLKLRLLLARP
jgi:hypothetical protein